MTIIEKLAIVRNKIIDKMINYIVILTNTQMEYPKTLKMSQMEANINVMEISLTRTLWIEAICLVLIFQMTHLKGQIRIESIKKGSSKQMQT